MHHMMLHMTIQVMMHPNKENKQMHFQVSLKYMKEVLHYLHTLHHYYSLSHHNHYLGHYYIFQAQVILLPDKFPKFTLYMFSSQYYILTHLSKQINILPQFMLHTQRASLHKTHHHKKSDNALHTQDLYTYIMVLMVHMKQMHKVSHKHLIVHHHKYLTDLHQHHQDNYHTCQVLRHHPYHLHYLHLYKYLHHHRFHLHQYLIIHLGNPRNIPKIILLLP